MEVLGDSGSGHPMVIHQPFLHREPICDFENCDMVIKVLTTGLAVNNNPYLRMGSGLFLNDDKLSGYTTMSLSCDTLVKYDVP